MASLVVFVLDCIDMCPDILRSWEEAGAPGVTILESIGLGQLRAAVRDDLPLVPSLRVLFERQELHHRTIFTVIDDEETLNRVIAATEKVVGDFTKPHSGLLFVVPVSRVIGLKTYSPPDKED